MLCGSGFGETCGEIGTGGKTPKVSNVAVRRTLPCLGRRRRRVASHVCHKGCAPSPMEQIRVPGPSNNIQGLNVPAIVSHALRRTVARRLIPVCRPLFTSNDCNCHPGEDTGSTVLGIGRCTRRNCAFTMILSLSGCFSALGRRVLVGLLQGGMGSRHMMRLVGHCLGDNMVRGKIIVSARRNSPRNKGLSPLLTGICLGRFSRRFLGENIPYVECTSSVILLTGDKQTSRELLRDDAGCLRRELGLAIGQRGDHAIDIFTVQGFGFLNFTLKEGKGNVCIQIRPGS